MGLLDRLANLFSRGGRDDNLLQQGLAHAKAKRPTEAIAIYSRLIDSSGTSSKARASALFNRALAYSSLDDDAKALVDLERVLALPDVPDNVQTAARSQLARVKRRNPNPAAGGS
jgi:tetratricopeptide (TPR) repeat protein